MTTVRQAFRTPTRKPGSIRRGDQTYRSVSPQANPQLFGVAQYRVKCEPATPPPADKAFIRIEKITVGGNDTFGFQTTGGLAPSDQFNLTTVSGSAYEDFQVAFENDDQIRNFTITENVPPAGWDYTSLNCKYISNPSNASTFTIDSGNRKVDVSIKKGASLSCAYTNTKRGSLKIIKEVENGNDETFVFSVTDPNGGPVTLDNSVLGDGESGAATNLIPGAPYVITETLPSADWSMTVSGSNCTKVGNEIKATVAPGQQTVCTVTNTKVQNQTGKVIINKTSVNGDGETTFSFGGGLGSFDLKPPANGTLSETFNVASGTYTVTEAPVAGWTTSVSCTETIATGQTTVSGNAATIRLDEGDEVQCTFKNTKKIDDRASEETKRFVNRRVDNLLTYGPDRARMLRRLGEAPPEQQSLKDGPMKLNGATPGATSAAPASRTSSTAPLPDLFGSRTPSGSMALGANPFSNSSEQGISSIRRDRICRCKAHPPPHRPEFCPTSPVNSCRWRRTAGRSSSARA